MDSELLPGSGSGIIVPDPDPAKYERADKKKCNFSVNSGLCVLYDCSMKYKMANSCYR